MVLNRYLLVCLAVVLVGCGAPGQSPATSDPTTSSGTPTTTTSSTTTPSAPSTTSTLATTTTTVPAPEGDALVVSQHFVLGWWADGAWQQDPEYRPLGSGQEFQVFSVEDNTYSVIGGEPVATCDWIVDEDGQTPPTRKVPLELESASIFGPIGVSAPWTVESGEIEHVEPDQSLIDIAVNLLAKVGIEESNPKFAQVIETDLDGDGATETLVTLDRAANAVVDPATQPYGLAFAVGEGGGVAVLGEVETIEDESGTVATTYRFLSVMDVNGDGSDEVGMVASPRWSTVYRLYEHDGYEGLELALSSGCGV